MASPVYDPHESRYWDPSDLLDEQRRQYDVCHGCRLCWNLCPAFPKLFDLTDKVEGESRQLEATEIAPVEDLCFQCKLCWVVCPYTDPHDYKLDIPRLIQRSTALKAKVSGIPFARKLSSDQDRLAKLVGGPLAPITNLVNSIKPMRQLSAIVTGIHPDAKLPTYQTPTVTKWFNRKYGEVNRLPEEPSGKVVFFASCTVDYSEQQIGHAILKVLDHNNVQVAMPGQRCCGMPLVDAGDYAGAETKMMHNLRMLSSWVDDGYDIVVAQPTCALMIREEYLRNSRDQDLASKVSRNTYEFGHYLVSMARADLLTREFSNALGRVAVHVACHTRAQAVGNNSVRILGIVPDTQVEVTESCSGHDGFWGISKEYFPLSLKVGQKLFNNLGANSPDLVVSDCPLAAHHIEIGTGYRPVHTAEALAMAYGLIPMTKVSE